MGERRPPSDTPNFNSLGHERTRAFTVWMFLRMNHGTWFTTNQISEGSGLAESTVRSALSRIFGLPRVMRPRLERHTIVDDRGRLTFYRFRRIVEIRFEEEDSLPESIRSV